MCDLDGGGVRGLSTLLILKALMAAVNVERGKDRQLPVKPCELFDLIGGTSTRGLVFACGILISLTPIGSSQ
jgi:patatin-like phospholipase/acyl hydrolase